MEKMVENNGGKNSSVGKSLTALVWDGSIQGDKIEKAKKFGIPIINQKNFLDMLK
jgi:NAD-dependent DNA ligase